MQIINGIENLPNKCKNNIFIALGNFDGVHLGHQSVIKKTVQKAKGKNLLSGALIFEPHPAKIIYPGSNLQILTDVKMKADILTLLGLDYLIVEPFNSYIAQISPHKFLDIYIKDSINAKGVVTGFDYSFGKNALGNTQSLNKWGIENNVEIVVCPPVNIEGNIVSSSNIRGMLSEGKVKEASKFLNYYYYRYGEVVKGDGRGEKIGFPTANIKVAKELILPDKGVYYTIISKDDKLFYGATNVGIRPTFSSGELTVEVNILNFKSNIYGSDITVYFIEKIREEFAFSTVDALKKQLSRDIGIIRKLAQEPLEGMLPRVNNYKKISTP